VELSLDGLLVAAGLHHASSDQLGRFRAAIDDARPARAFERAVAGATEAGLGLAERRSSARRAATRPTTRASTSCA